MVQPITHQLIQNCFPQRDSTSHKYTNGFVTTFVGSFQYPGAVRLCCHAAAQAGAGGVYALLPQSLWPLIGAIPAEVIPYMIKEHDGVLSIVDSVENFLIVKEKSTAILMGPGIGRHPSLNNLLKSMLSRAELPCVIDGDGLSILGQLGEDFLVQQSQGRWLLTPHRGEWQQLLNSFGYNSAISPQELAVKWGCTILLKGFPSHIYTVDGQVYVNTTGNPAATTAGCGDVLAGLIAGYVAQGLRPDQAASVGIYLAGQAADRLVAVTRRHSLMATEILAELGVAPFTP
jgi:NAD(P)H-hydrate epimerase